MSSILAVFGATGVQGGSLIDYVLNDPELSQKYQIRAITRNVNSEKIAQLKNKVEVVQADVSDPVSIDTALMGAHTVFAMTVPSFTPDGLEVEFSHGKTIADAAVRQGVEYLIFSTLPGVNEISGGKYSHVTPFDAKAKIEHYIRDLPIRNAFVSLGFFMQNLHTQPFLGPVPAPDDTWVLARPAPRTSTIPYIDAVANVGNVVGSILAEPEKYEGKTFCAAERLYSLGEIAALLSRSSGKTVVYKQVTLEEFKNSIPFAADVFSDGFGFLEEFGGYWGPSSEKAVDWAVQNTRGKLRSLEEYLEANPIQL
ncbi:hypothetical protein TMatcc_010644 [Talaromyces marneffei ATCC 18224]|uniref:Hscarg dehydrogenase, putative n=1 Tax=Talaromyces marneffei (strain ATCC 18224 / CBS 334.59 / QM 7333) TaxID=441960 RepID=B6QV20_TALMQ|nr:hscarg dehydrogenase, putative [Talaromyces marneffei ATCC 18224]